MFRASLPSTLVLLTALTTVAPAQEAASDSLLEAHGTEIATLYAEGRYAEAIETTRLHLRYWERERGIDSAEYCSVFSNLGPLHAIAGQLDEAAAVYPRAVECVREHFGAESEDLASTLNNYGSFLGQVADFARAELALRESVRLLRATLGDDHVYVAITLNNLAVNQQNQGNDLLAEHTFREAVELLRSSLGEEHPTTATATNNLGRLLVARGAYDEAEPLLRTALEVRRRVRGEDHRDTAISHRDLGRLLRRRGDASGAEVEFRRSLDTFRGAAEPDLPNVAMGHHELGRALADQGLLDEARLELRTALALDRTLYEPGHASFVLVPRELGGIEFRAGHVDSALVHLRAAAEAFEIGRSQSGDEFERATYIDNPWVDVAVAHLELGQYDAAWDALSRSQGRVIEEQLTGGAPMPEAQPPTGTVVLGWIDAELSGLTRAWAWVWTSEGVHWARLENDVAGAAAFDALRREIAQPGPLSTLRTVARRVYDARVRPMEAYLVRARHVVIVPTGPMLGIPVAALLDDEGRWLADRWTFSYAPSTRVHALLRQGAPRREGPALFVGDPPLGVQSELARMDSPLDEDVVRGAAHGLRDAIEALPPLPGAGDEVRRLAARWHGSTMLVGRSASEARLAEMAETDALRGFSVLHFATHALVDADDSDASTLVLSQLDLPDPVQQLGGSGPLTDGLITSREVVSGWRLDADLVTLSACNSALGRSITGEGHVGFAYAFLRAGARSTLVSQWSVPDRATAEFMETFYTAWREDGHSRADALALAQHTLRSSLDSAGRRVHDHPYYWAPFVLFGDER